MSKLNKEWAEFSDVSFKSIGPKGQEVLFNLLLMDTERSLIRIKQLEEESMIDGPTGAGTRKMASRRFEDHSKSGVDKKIGVLMCDIDYFKAINDTYGHATGDKVLARLVEEVKKLLREGDIIARFGGEEFVIILEGDALEVRNIAERIRKHVEKFSHEDKELPSFTVSIGCAEGSAKTNHLDNLLAEADKELYKAKANRNKISGLTTKALALQVEEKYWPL